MSRLTFLSLFLLSAFSAAGQEHNFTPRILPPDLNQDREQQMMRSYLREKAHKHFHNRRKKLEQLDTPEKIAAYQAELRAFFRETVNLDSFPQSPLNPQVTGILERDGYRVEKVLFESQPGFHVSAILYLPDGNGPFPGILHPCGHSENGKAYESYQLANQLLVKNGFAVLCYDPIGQGERKQLLNEKGAGLLKSTSEHQILGRAPVLLGRGLAGYMIHDGIRALDYLASRPEVDPERLGCTGNSGGGNMTAFLMALDPRVKAAAPGCFITTLKIKNERPGPGDPEQILFGQIAAGLDHPDFAIIRAPKPTLILAATNDFVPIEGTWDAFRQTKRIYGNLGDPERIDLIEANEKHGYSLLLREGAARFFSRWLQDRNTEIIEPDSLQPEKEEDLLASPKGQVLSLPEEKSLFDLNAAYATHLEKNREAKWNAQSPEEKRSTIGKLLKIEDIKLTQIPITREGLPPHHSTSIIKAGRLTLPRLDITRPDGKKEATYLVLDDRGIPAAYKFYQQSLDAPDVTQVSFIDLCDIGETKTTNWRFYGADWAISLMLGESFMKYRVEEILAIARAESGKPLHLFATGELAPAALHAAAIEPDLFTSITLHKSIHSWEDLMRKSDPIPDTHTIVHRILHHYDLPDLKELISCPLKNTQ